MVELARSDASHGEAWHLSSPKTPSRRSTQSIVPEELPNLVPDRPTTTGGSKLNNMNRDSQTYILGSTTIESGEYHVSPDYGSRMILSMPLTMYAFIGVPVLCQAVLSLACGHLDCPADAGLRPSARSQLLERALKGQ